MIKICLWLQVALGSDFGHPWANEVFVFIFLFLFFYFKSLLFPPQLLRTAPATSAWEWKVWPIRGVSSPRCAMLRPGFVTAPTTVETSQTRATVQVTRSHANLILSVLGMHSDMTVFCHTSPDLFSLNLYKYLWIVSAHNFPNSSTHNF